MASPRPAHPYNPQYPLPNGAVPPGPATAPVQVPVAPPTSHPPLGATGLLPNQGRVIQTGPVRVLCIADVRGNLRSLNELAAQARADHIIHTGDFGFYDDTSLERIAEKTLRHVVQWSPLVSPPVKETISKTPPQQSIKQRFTPDQLPLSELPLLLSGQLTLNVPVYTVWGACEDVRVLEKFRSGEYKVHNLHIIDEANSRLLDVGGVKLRLLGLGGAVVMHKLFDNGEGKTTIAGGQGTMWTTLLQMGELVDTANRVYDPSETRVFVTHTSPAREGMLNQLSVTLKADFSISAGLHFRYGSSYNEFSVNPSLDHYRGKLAASKSSFNDVWDTVKGEVEAAINSNEAQRTLLDSALAIVQKMPTVANGGNPFGGSVASSDAGQVDECAFKNMWNFNLADAAFGWLVLEIEGCRIGTEMRAQGFNFSHRTGKHHHHHPPHPAPAHHLAPGPVPAAPVPVPVAGAPHHFAQAPTPVPVPAATPRAPAGPFPPQQAAPVKPVQSPVPVPIVPPTPVAPQQQQQQGAPRAPAAPANVPAGPAADQQQQQQQAAPKTSTPGPAAPERTGTPGTPGDKPAQAPAAPTERKPALFVMHVESEPATRDIFPEPDRAKIVKVEKWGKFNNHVVTFATLDDARAAYERQPIEHKKSSGGGAPGQPRKPNVKWFEDRPPRGQAARERAAAQAAAGGSGSGAEGGNAGTWQASSRGSGRSGYQSGSATSDTEGGRRGFRGRGGGRGMDRGRGSGRGRGGRAPGSSLTPPPQQAGAQEGKSAGAGEKAEGKTESKGEAKGEPKEAKPESKTENKGGEQQ